MIGLAVGPTSALLLATASGQWSRLLWHGEAWSAAYNRSHFISLYSVLNILFIFSYLIWSSAFLIFYVLLILYLNAHSLFIFHFFSRVMEKEDYHMVKLTFQVIWLIVTTQITKYCAIILCGLAHWTWGTKNRLKFWSKTLSPLVPGTGHKSLEAWCSLIVAYWWAQVDNCPPHHHGHHYQVGQGTWLEVCTAQGRGGNNMAAQTSTETSFWSSDLFPISCFKFQIQNIK